MKVGFTNEGGGKDGGAGVIESKDDAFEAHATKFLHALSF